ncbi:MAG: NusA-like transcription termination signal-binding factor [Thermoprotei archaeon]|nr:MAG: NusA-like transcription termination signal-binding factor [Thermoprotei archaeon]RLE97353.1 MAG: NusA-like transcription termination signal-binding factor [Thermoprotei archaeon]
MPSIKLTELEMQYISLFEAVTQVEAVDCVVDEECNRVIFVVKRGMAGKAIGGDGANVKMLRRLLQKDVDIVEESDTLEGLLRSALFPASVKSIEVKRDSSGRKIVVVEVPPEQKGLAIGRRGRNVKKVRLLAKRYFDVDHVALK